MSHAEAFGASIDAAGLRHFTRVEHHRATGSTNEDAQRRLGDPSAGGLVIVADEQTAGVGRHGRRWIAPSGSGLLFTAVLPEPVVATDAWGVTFWCGLRVAKALERWTRVSLQWPNDLLADGRKLCGILCVSRIVGNRAAIACGIGVNVHRPPNRPELEEIVPPPIFLDDVAVLGPDARPHVLVAILREFESELESLHDPERIARQWERAAGLPGARYRLKREDGTLLEGQARRLSQKGALIVDCGGREESVDLAAEVRALR